MKVVAYAICKNESKFVDRWYNSVKEADEIYVLDTGSTDNTIELFKKYPKVTIKQEIFEPFRFDTARNHSLDMVPEDADICVCTDLDEVFDPGWRKKVEEVWTDDTTNGRYLIYSKVKANKEPEVSFYINKIHTRFNHHWEHSIHEILVCEKPRKEVTIDIILYHYPDNTKSRGQYLGLLETAVQDNPNDARDLYCLAREYYSYKRYDESIEHFHKYLKIKNAWCQERSSAMRYMAKCYEGKGYLEEAILWYTYATEETPEIREVYYDLARAYFNHKEYEMAREYFRQCLKIKKKNGVYLNLEYAWNDSAYDYLSCCEYRCGNYKEAVDCAKKAMKAFPEDERIKDNYKMMKEVYEKKKAEAENAKGHKKED